MTDGTDWVALTRYLSGEAGPDERAAVEAWTAADVERQTLLQSLERVRDASADLGDPFDTELSWLDAQDRLGISEDFDPMPEPRLQYRRPLAITPVWNLPHTRRPWWQSGLTATLAAAVTVVGVATVWWLGVFGRSTYHMTQIARTYETVPGQRLSVTLPDGTNVTIAPGTRLRISRSYEMGGAREVSLEGQAYFAVVHDGNHPFTVHTPDAAVSDVGTEFDISAYPADGGTRVVVAEGQVIVGAPFRQTPANTMASGMTLNAGDVATIGDAAVAVTHEPDVSDLVAWHQGQLVFRNTPLSDVVRTLERTFDLRVTLADTGLATLPVTGSFGDASATTVLDAITQVVGAQYQRVGNRITIRRQVGAARPVVPAAPPPALTQNQ